MTAPPPKRRLYRHLTFAEGVASVWSALASVWVGLVLPLVLAPEVSATLPPDAVLSAHARFALNPWLGHFLGAVSSVTLGWGLFWPLRQELGRFLVVLSLVVALASGLYTSWALQGALS